MKNEKLKSGAAREPVLLAFLILNFAFLISVCRAAEQFGDISAEPGAIYTGYTFHGYAEMRVVLENHSHGKAHTVTLIFPNDSRGGGNTLSRMSRTVTLAPGVREIVSLLQPPLPAYSDNLIRVEVDNHREGEIRAPNANSHCNNYARGGQLGAALISRSLDFDAVNNALQPDGGAGAAVRGASSPASEAVGAPGAFRSGHKDLSAAWMPDLRLRTSGHWLEVDYAPTQTVEKILIHSVQAPLRSGSVTVVGNSGTNLLTTPMSAARYASDHGKGWNVEFTFPQTTEPVKTVRLEFGMMPPSAIAIDGVQISGPSGSQWATNARASSENTGAVPPPAYPTSYRSGGMVADAIECLRAESPVSEWSENWLAYSPFDAIVLTAADMNLMSPAVLGAVGDYLSAGGNVVLAGQTDLPVAWHPSQKKNLPDGVEYDVGFGRCFAFNPPSPAVLDAKSIQTVREAVREAAHYWQSLPADSGSANAVLPVVENLKIPTRGIVIIMLAFVVIIGPVNIIYLNRCQRRTWMLWTIPAISLVTTLLVFAYSLLREGVTPDTRITGLTVIDQAGHHATTIGGTAFYCPLTPGGGLRFDFETEATPLIQTGYGAGNSREVDWTQSQHLQRGWVSARVPAHFHLRKSETRRERIQVVNENGRLQIVNGLGVAIKSLWVADANMNYYEANNVAAGQKAGLILAKPSPSPEKAGANGLLHDISFAARLDSLSAGAGKYLLPNTYLAVLDGNPFIENALGPASSPKRTKSSSVVFGILESPEAK